MRIVPIYGRLIGPNGKTNRDCQLQLREPLLKSDEYLSKNGHNETKLVKSFNKLLTLTKFYFIARLRLIYSDSGRKKKEKYIRDRS